jgi:hypothetical protein
MQVTLIPSKGVVVNNGALLAASAASEPLDDIVD